MTIYSEIQPMIDSNPYVSGNANASNCIETEQYVLYASDEVSSTYSKDMQMHTHQDHS